MKRLSGLSQAGEDCFMRERFGGMSYQQACQRVAMRCYKATDVYASCVFIVRPAIRGSSLLQGRHRVGDLARQDDKLLEWNFLGPNVGGHARSLEGGSQHFLPPLLLQ